MYIISRSVHRGDCKCLQLLLTPVQTYFKDQKGRTVMHLAAEIGSTTACDLILDMRVDAINDLDRMVSYFSTVVRDGWSLKMYSKKLCPFMAFPLTQYLNWYTHIYTLTVTHTFTHTHMHTHITHTHILTLSHTHSHTLTHQHTYSLTHTHTHTHHTTPCIQGRTPLHYAAACSRVDVCALLLDRGSSAAQKDLTGKTAIEYARMKKLDYVVALLTCHGSAVADFATVSR